MPKPLHKLPLHKMKDTAKGQALDAEDKIKAIKALIKLKKIPNNNRTKETLQLLELRQRGLNDISKQKNRSKGKERALDLRRQEKQHIDKMMVENEIKLIKQNIKENKLSREQIRRIEKAISKIGTNLIKNSQKLCIN